MMERDLLEFMGEGNPERCPDILCQARLIIGFEEEYELASTVLERHSRLGRTMFCTRSRRNPACLYMQMNVKWEDAASHNAKLCARFDEIVKQNKVAGIVERKAIETILVPDEFTERVMKRLAPGHLHYHVVSEACPPGCLGSSKSLMERLSGLFSKRLLNLL